MRSTAARRRAAAKTETHRVLLLATLGVLIGWQSAAANGAGSLQSGYYEGLMLAVDSDGSVTGYFREDQGEGVTKSCSFFLAGQRRDDRAEVATWSSSKLRGEISPTASGVMLRLPQGREHDGCGLVLPPSINTGLTLDKVYDAGWRELRRIAAERAYLHPAPAGRPGRAFVVRGDVVGVLERHGSWLQVEYRGANRSTRGWVRDADAERLRPLR